MRIALILALLLVGCSTPKPVDLPNFRAVSGHAGVYRGGQPTEKGWAVLFELGISNVIKLNVAEYEGTDDPARALGMTVVELPIDTLHQTLLKPSLLTLSNAVNSITPGTYVHCSHGQDRTGIVIGCLRIWRDGWTNSDAYDEMRAHGFHPSLVGLQERWNHL